MLLWIAVAGAALGFYSLSLSPFVVPAAADRRKSREADDA
jgi:hypothetical protein